MKARYAVSWASGGSGAPSSLLRMRMNAKSLIIAGDGFRDSLHCLLEVLVTRIDEKPLLQYVVRRQFGGTLRGSRVVARVPCRSARHAILVGSTRPSSCGQTDRRTTSLTASQLRSICVRMSLLGPPGRGDRRKSSAVTADSRKCQCSPCASGPGIDFSGAFARRATNLLPRHIRAMFSTQKTGTSAARQVLARGQINDGGRSTPPPPMHRAPPLGTIGAHPWS
jgi:hypothetical protein